MNLTATPPSRCFASDAQNFDLNDLWILDLCRTRKQFIRMKEREWETWKAGDLVQTLRSRGIVIGRDELTVISKEEMSKLMRIYKIIKRGV